MSGTAKVTVKEKTSTSISNGDQGGKQSMLYLSVMGILLLLSGLVMMYRRTKVKK